MKQEEFNQRIISVQHGRNTTHAHIALKQKIREKLDTDLAEFLKNGGEIKQAVNNVIVVKHGTSDQFVKRSCRCDECVAWSKSRIKKRKV